MDSENKDNKYLKAKQRVTELKSFYSNLMFYVIFILGLAGLNYYTDQWRYPWFLWAAVGWGIGLLFHAAKVFGWPHFLGKEWEERKLKKFMEEEEKQKKKEWKE